MRPRHVNGDIRKTKWTGSSSLSGDHAKCAEGELPTLHRGIDFRAAREAMTIAQVLELIEWAPASRSGAQARGPCPIHKSSSPQSRNFSVNTAASVFQCFGCGEKGNQLDLWAAITGLPIYEATLDLSRRLQIDPARIFKST